MRVSIGKLAKAAKVSIYTIRFYEKSGLLPQPMRRPSGFREYSERDVLQLKFVREARALGFSLEEIAELMALERESDSARSHVLVQGKLQAIDQKITRLQQWRNALLQLCGPERGERTKSRFLSRFVQAESPAAGSAADVSNQESIRS